MVVRATMMIVIMMVMMMVVMSIKDNGDDAGDDGGWHCGGLRGNAWAKLCFYSHFWF